MKSKFVNDIFKNLSAQNNEAVALVKVGSLYMAWLHANALSTIDQRANIVGYEVTPGKFVYVLGEGRLVNLACGDGHPAEIMDMSFAIQALSAKYLVEHKDALTEKLIVVPTEVDNEVANRKLRFLGIEIDELTEEQKKYLNASIV